MGTALVIVGCLLIVAAIGISALGDSEVFVINSTLDNVMFKLCLISMVTGALCIAGGLSCLP